MASDGHAILFVHLGEDLPPWLGDSLGQALLFNTCPVYLAANAASLKKAALPQAVTPVALEEVGASPKQRAFHQVSILDSNFLGGFWTYTTERFFVIESVMAALGLVRVVHLENDVLFYAELDDLAPRLAAVYPALAATFDNDERCVPGLVYIADVAAIARLTDFLLEALKEMHHLPSEQRRRINDMMLLSEFRRQHREAVALLPIVPPDYPAPLRSRRGHLPQDPKLYSQHYQALGMVFDAAALGQYLGGLDQRLIAKPSRGFINESCLFNPQTVKPGFITDKAGLRRPVIETPSGLHRVCNLHIHSKNLSDFLSRGAPA